MPSLMSAKSEFKDYFSNQAQEYAIYRPNYPSVLFEYLDSIVHHHRTVWDCGTGSGQVALELTKYFDKVYASDASENQIQNASLHPKIQYFVSTAESTHLKPKSIDLVTVAQALHWFDLDGFYTEVKRILQPKGILAVWCYGLFQIPLEEVHLKLALQNFYATVEPYWPPERHLIDEQYRTISFPFLEIKQAPQFLMQKEWTINQLIGYLLTWSSTQKCIDSKGEAIVLSKLENMSNSVSSPEKLISVQWPIYWRVGRLRL